MSAMSLQGIFFLLAGPTAAGKTSVLKHLVAGEKGLEKDVSVTTRPRREGEVDGRDYHFWDRAEVNRELERLMTTAYGEVAEMAETEKMDLRMAVHALAVQRVAEAVRLRGIYP